MIEVLEFIFGSFWRWLGAFLLVSAVANGIGQLLNRVIVKIKK